MNNCVSYDEMAIQPPEIEMDSDRVNEEQNYNFWRSAEL